MADGWALASGRAAFVNLHAMGGLGNAMGVLVASKASETPLVVTAGQQDTRHLMTEPWLSGDLVALAEPVTKWAKELRRGEDVGQALRRAFALCAHAAERAGLPVAADGHPRPGGERPDAAGVLAAAARPLARRGAACGDARRLRSGPGRRAARRRSAGGGERRPGRLRRGRRLSGVGNATHLPRRVSVRASLLGGRAEARFRRHARPLQGAAGDRARRRTRLRRLSLSRRRAGAGGRRGPACRRQPGGVRTRTRRRHGAPRRHRTDPRRGGRTPQRARRPGQGRGAARGARGPARATPGKRRASIFWPKARTRR